MRDFDGRTDLWKAAIKRRADAHRLAASGYEHGAAAVYLAGVALECKLKALALESHGAWNLSELQRRLGLGPAETYSHRLEFLLQLIPAWTRFRDGPGWQAFSKTLSAWRPSWRYRPADISLEYTKGFMVALDKVFSALDRIR